MGLVEMKPEIARFVLLGDRGQADKRTRQTSWDETVLCCHSVQSFKLNKSKLQVSPLLPRLLFHFQKSF